MAEKGNGTKISKHKHIALSSSKKQFEFTNPLEKEIKYMGEKVKLKLFENPNGFSYIVWKNRKYMLDIIEKNQNKYTVMVNGVWHTFTIESPFSLKRKRYLEKQEGTSTKELVRAPMPGKIIDILVEEGAEINSGEPILILEAMKMQNEINCHINGVIKKISVKKNDSVMKDDLMIEIERR